MRRNCCASVGGFSRAGGDGGCVAGLSVVWCARSGWVFSTQHGAICVLFQFLVTKTGVVPTRCGEPSYFTMRLMHRRLFIYIGECSAFRQKVYQMNRCMEYDEKRQL